MSDDTSKHIVLTYLDTIGANGYTEKYVDDLANLIDAARSAALEEAAAHLDWRQEATRMAGVKCKEIGSDDDAVRYAHYSQAHGAAAAAIRELKDKS